MEEQIDPQGFAGTSIGSLVAALLAAGHSGTELRDDVPKWDLGRLVTKRRRKFHFSLRAIRSSVVENTLEPTYEYAKLLDKLDDKLGERDIETFGDIKQAGRFLSVVACQLGADDPLAVFSSNDTTFASMRIRDAVAASMAAPMYFSPSFSLGRVMIDGGLVGNLPLLPFKEISQETGIPVLAFEFRERARTSGALVDYLPQLVTAVSTSLNRKIVPNYTPIRIDTTVDAFDFKILKSEERVRDLIREGTASSESFLKRGGHVPSIGSIGQGGYYLRRKITEFLNGLQNRLRDYVLQYLAEASPNAPQRSESYWLKYYAFSVSASGQERFEPTASCIKCEGLEAGHSMNPEVHIGYRYDSRNTTTGRGVVWLARDLFEKNVADGNSPFKGLPLYFGLDGVEAKKHMAPSTKKVLGSGGVKSIATIPVFRSGVLLGALQVCSSIEIPIDGRKSSATPFYGSPEFDRTLEDESLRLSKEIARWGMADRW